MIFNFLYLCFSTSYPSSLLSTDTIVFSKLNKPPRLYEAPPPPQMGLK